MKFTDKWTFMRVLLHLWSTVNGVTLTDLRRKIGHKVTVAHIDWLEQHRYVHRVHDMDDHRQINIYLTVKAKPVCKALYELVDVLPEDLKHELLG